MSTTAIILIIVFAIVLFFILLSLFTGIKVVPQSNCYVIERLGKFHKSWTTGIHIRIPIIDRIARRISLKEQVVSFKPQPVITRDNVTMEIDTVLFYMVTDTKLYTYGVERPIYAIENLTTTTLRNAIGDIELDKTLTSRDQVNARLQASLDEATAAWGIKVIRVELKNIMLPVDIRNAMEKQMRAEREKRANILNAEGFKRAKVLEAEGIKEATIQKALGKAKSLLINQEALAKSIQIVNRAKPSAETLKLRSFAALEQVANGQSTKIIIPSNLQNLASVVAGLSSVAKGVTDENLTSEDLGRAAEQFTNDLDSDMAWASDIDQQETGANLKDTDNNDNNPYKVDVTPDST